MIPVEEWSETQSNALKQRNGSELPWLYSGELSGHIGRLNLHYTR